MKLNAGSLCTLACFLAAGGISLARGNSFVLNSYSELNHRIQHFIVKAEKRIWIASRMLSDGSLSTSLYLAKYRGIQVAVILSKKFKHHYLSQWNVLKRNHIPVAEVSDSFFRGWSALVIVDQKVWTSNIPLVKFYKRKEHKLRKTGKRNSEILIKRFWSYFTPGAAPNLARKSAKITKEEKQTDWRGFETYQYSRARQKRPRGIPRRLPKITKWKQRRKSH